MTEQLNNIWQAALDKGMIHIPGGTKLDRMVCDLKLMNCFFMEYSTQCFWTTLDLR